MLKINELEENNQRSDAWLQFVLHEVSYFNRRYEVYTAGWAHAYEQCSLSLSRPKRPMPTGDSSLWQAATYNETSRLNTNYFRKPKYSRFNQPVMNWNESVLLNAWILRQKPLPKNKDHTAWDLAFTTIMRQTFRKRRFGWEICMQREVDNMDPRRKDFNNKSERDREEIALIVLHEDYLKSENTGGTLL